MAEQDSLSTRRSALLQERSRSTRRRLVRAALERGIEETTAAEIAAAAGVSKATFYLHFARKEDILHEMAHAAAVAFEVATDAALARSLPMQEVFDILHTSLAKRVEGTGRVAVARSLAEEKRRAILSIGDDPSRFGLSYERVLKYGQDRGELPKNCDHRDAADMLEALTLDAVERWARGAVSRVKPVLRWRTRLILKGLVSTESSTAVGILDGDV
jgi:AcrR family transcriptional regulator